MTQNDRHIRNSFYESDKSISSFTPSPAHTALSWVLKVVGIILGIIIGIVFWVVVKPMVRGIGWLISGVTLIAIIYWILTF